MKTLLHSADRRGHFKFGWLDARYSFSFNRWFDPERVQFGALRVLNDDRIAPGGGFGTHPHENMEIVTIPLEGVLRHRDSTGESSTIGPGAVQAMSAGTGVTHSEFNASRTEPIQLLQLWVFPKRDGVRPQYGEQHFDLDANRDAWTTLVTSIDDEQATDTALRVHQDAVFSRAKLTAGRDLDYRVRFAGNGVYAFLIDGRVRIGEQVLDRRDALGITGADALTVQPETDADLLLVEVPMQA
ncbi:MAG: pirin family protein [Catalinimonas sp.]